MQTLIHFYRLIRPYWCNRKQWLAWLLLAGVLGFSLLIIEVGVYINHWNNAFYDALTAFETEKILPLSLQYLGYMALVVLCVAIGSWLRKLLIIRWRTHLTRQFEENWLTQHKLYRLTLKQEQDNPDQRIAEDVAMLAEKSLDLLKNLCMNIAKIVAFVGILWQISGVIEFEIAGTTIRLSGYLVWLALIYTLEQYEKTTIFSELSHKFNEDWKGLLKLNHTDSRSLFLYAGYPNWAAYNPAGSLLSRSRYDFNLKEIGAKAEIIGKYELFGRKHDLFANISGSREKYVRHNRFARGLSNQPFDIYHFNRSAIAEGICLRYQQIPTQMCQFINKRLH